MFFTVSYTPGTTRRQGTQNQGISYEIKICALFGLRCLDPKYEVDTFEIWQNLEGYGNFDDVILTVKKTFGQSFKFCMQLKHFQLDGKERKKKLKYNHFCDRKTKGKEPFNLKNYRDTLKGTIETRNTYVLFTNKQKDKTENKFVPCNREGMELINIAGDVFFFDRILPSNSEETWEVEEEERFLNQLVILCNQPHEEDLNNVIKQTLKDVFGLDDIKAEEVCVKYVEHVTNWTNGYCRGERCLTKSEIQFKLTEFITNPFVKNLEQDLNVSADKSIAQLTRICKNYKMIMAENVRTQETFDESFSFVSACILATLHNFTQISNWTRTLFQQDLEYFYQKCSEFDAGKHLEELWGNEKVNQVTLSKIYRYLWKQDVLPLVLRVDNENDLKIVFNASNFSSGQFIIFYNGKMPEEFNEDAANKYIRSFVQLCETDQNLLLDQPITFQGKEVEAKAVFHNKQIVSKLCILDVIDILQRKFCIGKKNFDVPKYFIERTLRNILIKPEVFKHQQVVNVIICKSREKFLQYVDRKHIKIEGSQFVVLEKTKRNESSKIKFPKRYKVLICSNYTSQEISEEIFSQTVSGANTFYDVYNLENEFLDLKMTTEPRKERAVHVIVNSKEAFLQYANLHDVKIESFEIFDVSTVDIDFLPITCKYILADSEQDLRKARKITNAHFYKIHETAEENLLLEWLGSHCLRESVTPFVDNSTQDQVKENFDFNYFYAYNKLNLIAGPPGMGKSVLINHLIKNCPLTLWPLLINCNEQSKYFQDNEQNLAEVDKHMKYFLGYANFTAIEKTCADYYIKSRNICLYFDGFDEVQPEMEKTVRQFLKIILEKGFSLFVTTRTIKKEHLEKFFHYPARTIVPFNESDQFQYLTAVFNAKIPWNEVKVDEFVTKLLTRKGMSAWDVEFSGIPLQTLMISEIYEEECLRYCINLEDNLQVKIDVLQIYEQFINLKIENLQRKERINHPNVEKYFKIAVKQSLENHKLCAIEAIFNQSVGTDLSSFIQEIKSGEEKIGLIDKFLEDGVPVFVHRTFAEYLVALYVSENFRNHSVKNLVNTILQNATYDIIRQILDRLLCKSNALHLALLNLDADTFIHLLSDETQKMQLDEGGRNILHLAMSWGRRHALLNDPELNDLSNTIEWNSFTNKLESAQINCRKGPGSEMLTRAIFSCAWSADLLQAKDLILGATPFEYALKVMALENINVFLKQYRDPQTIALKSFFDRFDYSQMLFICALFDYSALAASMLRNRTIKMSSLWIIYYGKFNIPLLHFAAWCASNEIIDFLINRDPELINLVEGRRNQNALHWAAGKGNTTTVELLIRKGCNVKASDYLRRSPLYIASENRNEDVVEVLAEAEAKLGGKRTKITKLFVAANAGNLEEVRNLLDSGESPNEASDGGGWPLTRAAYSGNVDMVKLLLDRGAEVNVTDDDNWSGLMEASWRGHADVARVLLDAGADVNIAELCGLTNALKLAQHWNHKEIVEMLTNVGTKK